VDRADNLLDTDARYLGLGNNSRDRKPRYTKFLQTGISSSEQQFIQNSVSRNQLTGSCQFVDKIERRTGLRIEQRGKGRPRYDGK
jgi:putative transposase